MFRMLWESKKAAQLRHVAISFAAESVSFKDEARFSRQIDPKSWWPCNATSFCSPGDPGSRVEGGAVVVGPAVAA